LFIEISLKEIFQSNPKTHQITGDGRDVNTSQAASLSFQLNIKKGAALNKVYRLVLYRNGKCRLY